MPSDFVDQEDVFENEEIEIIQTSTEILTATSKLNHRFFIDKIFLKELNQVFTYSKDGQILKAKCNICNSDINRNKGNTTAMWNHLHSYHKQTFESLKASSQPAKIAKITNFTTSQTKYTQGKLFDL